MPYGWTLQQNLTPTYAHVIRNWTACHTFLLLSHHQKWWSLIGWNRVTWPVL